MPDWPAELALVSFVPGVQGQDCCVIAFVPAKLLAHGLESEVAGGLDCTGLLRIHGVLSTFIAVQSHCGGWSWALHEGPYEFCG